MLGTIAENFEHKEKDLAQGFKFRLKEIIICNGNLTVNLILFSIFFCLT